MLWFSLLVLIPLAAVVGHRASDGGWSGFWDAITNEQTAARRSGSPSAPRSCVTLVNVVMGTLIAWVLVARPLLRQARPRGAHRHPVRAADDRRRPGAAVALRAGQPARHRHRQHPARGLPRLPLRHAAVRRAHGAAGARRARPRGRRRPPRRSARAGSPPSAGSSCPASPRPSPPAPRCPSPAASASTARWCCSRATCPIETEVTSVRILSSIENDNLDGRGGRRRRSCWPSRSR